MGRWPAVVVAVAAGLLAGCFGARPETTTARLHAPPPAGPVGDDVVLIDVALIERPRGDLFLNRQLWADADEQTVRADGEEQADSLERKAALERNGFRVGQVGGLLPPAQLQDLLLSPRSCQAHRVRLHAGHETAVPLGPCWPDGRFRLVRDGRPSVVTLSRAQCSLEVVPELADEGRIRLRCTPHVKHGEAKTAFAPLRGPDGVLRWDRREQQPEEVYSWLGWAVTVSPDEYVIIGARLDDGETLGEQFFLGGEEQPGVQRLLVLRTAHVPTPGGPPGEAFGRSPPLALRASMTAARGRGE